MIHEMKLQNKFYNFIKNGTKRIELRLNDEKRSLIKVGDTIRFFEQPNLVNYFDVTVVELLKYPSFPELFKDFPIEVLADKSFSKDELLNCLQKFYTVKEQRKYGVLGIRFNYEK